MMVRIDNIAVIHPVKSFALIRHAAQLFAATVIIIRSYVVWPKQAEIFSVLAGASPTSVMRSG